MYESAFGRLLGALLSPAATFRSIRERPSWAVALVLVVVLGLGVGLAAQARTDQRVLIHQALERSGQQLSEQQIDRAVEIQERFGSLLVAGGTLVSVGIILLVAAIYLAAFRLTGSDLTFRQSLAVYVHGLLPTALAAILAIPVILSQSSLTLTELTTRSFLASNLSFLAPEGASMPLVILLSNLDVFGLWSAVLIVVGYRIVARVSTVSAVVAVALLWGVKIAFSIVLAALQTGGFR